MATYGRPTPGMTRLMGTNGVGKALAPSSLLRPPAGGVSTADMIQHKGFPGMSGLIDPITGRRRTTMEAQALAPAGGFPINIRGSVGTGRDDGRRIGSAAGALGSGGTPTSQRGRFDRIMREGGSPEEAVDSAMTPSWVVAEQARNAGGLSQSQNYGNMGAPPLRTRPTGGAADWAGNSARGGNISFYADGTKDSGPKPKVAVVGERGPEVVVVPPRSAVIPNEMTALGDLVGDLSPEPVGPGDGEIRTDAQGNQWRYDAKQGRGIPVNPYILGNENAPSPNAFRATPDERYNDLASRLNALRQSGMAEGQAAAARVRGEQEAEDKRRNDFLATGTKVADADGGGTLYKTKYGTAIVGGNRPKSFTVENFEGGQATHPNLTDGRVDKESRTDAAERSFYKKGLNAYRASPTAITQANPYVAPTALEGITGMAEVDPRAKGMRRGGTDDFFNRPVLDNKDGTTSTASTMIIGTPDGEVIIPTVVNGQRLSDDDAIANFKKTGKHFGIFDSVDAADTYDKQLHKQLADRDSDLPANARRKAFSRFIANAPKTAIETPRRPSSVVGPERFRSRYDIAKDDLATRVSSGANDFKTNVETILRAPMNAYDYIFGKNK